MNNQDLQELLLLQTNITTIILVFVAIILSFVVCDLSVYLFKKYIKRGHKK